MKSEKEKAILLSAYKIFRTNGYSKSTVSDIAKGAGVGKGTIYEYFDSKYDLFYKMIEHLLEVSQESLTNALADDAHPIEKLKSFYRVNKRRASFAYSIDMSMEISDNKQILNKVLYIIIKNREASLKALRVLFQECIDKGIIKAVDTSYIAAFFYSICNQFANDSMLYQYTNRESELVISEDTFVDNFISMINV